MDRFFSTTLRLAFGLFIAVTSSETTASDTFDVHKDHFKTLPHQITFLDIPTAVAIDTTYKVTKKLKNGDLIVQGVVMLIYNPSMLPQYDSPFAATYYLVMIDCTKGSDRIVAGTNMDQSGKLSDAESSNEVSAIEDDTWEADAEDSFCH